MDSIATAVYPPLEWPYPVDPDSLVLNLTYEGEPVSKARARVGKNGNVYTPNKTRSYEAEVAWRMRAALGAYQVDGESRFALRCLFYRPNRQRIDCDNLLKAVSDAATGVVWVDDNQVVEVIGRMFLASDHPRAEIVITRVTNPSPRPSCPVCGKEVMSYTSYQRVYCTKECYIKAKGAKRQTLECRHCHEMYSLPESYARTRAGFCSRSCASSFYGEKKTARRVATWVCQDCGGPVSRKEYKRCRGCSYSHRNEPTSDYWKSREKVGDAISAALRERYKGARVTKQCTWCGKDITRLKSQFHGDTAFCGSSCATTYQHKKRRGEIE